MKKLIVIGGQHHGGKTGVLRRLEDNLGMRDLVVLQTGLVRTVVQGLTTGFNPSKKMQKVSFEGYATYQLARDPNKTGRIPFSRKEKTEDENTWVGVLALLREHYDQPDPPNGVLIIEGTAANPADVAALKHTLRYLKLQNPVFLGYRDSPRGKAVAAALEAEAKKYGFGYFDRADRDYDNHVNTIVDYILGWKSVH